MSKCTHNNDFLTIDDLLFQIYDMDINCDIKFSTGLSRVYTNFMEYLVESIHTSEHNSGQTWKDTYSSHAR